VRRSRRRARVTVEVARTETLAREDKRGALGGVLRPRVRGCVRVGQERGDLRRRPCKKPVRMMSMPEIAWKHAEKVIAVNLTNATIYLFMSLHADMRDQPPPRFAIILLAATWSSFDAFLEPPERAPLRVARERTCHQALGAFVSPSIHGGPCVFERDAPHVADRGCRCGVLVLGDAAHFAGAAGVGGPASGADAPGAGCVPGEASSLTWRSGRCIIAVSRARSLVIWSRGLLTR
jgi:hypothetical protein